MINSTPVRNAMIEGKHRPPFGFRAKRFSALGLHPVLETRPATFRYRNLCPGTYNLDHSRKIICEVPRWKRQQEIEEFSRRLSYRGENILKELEWLKSVNGPGWQDIPLSLPLHALSFPKAIRFPVKKFKSFAVPGPGTYGKNHNPFTRKEAKSRAKGFSFSNIPSFEHSSFAPRGLTSERPYYLPPNLYKIKSCTEELLSKRISKRGPYDLFTVERFPSRAVSNLSALTININLSDLSHPRNVFKGKFLNCGKDSIITSRLILKDKSLSINKDFDLGPGSYDPYPTTVITQASAPFNTSVQEVRPVIKCGLSAPPGRYNPEGKRKILGDGMKSVFLSKVKRELFKIEKYSWFDI